MTAPSPAVVGEKIRARLDPAPDIEPVSKSPRYPRRLRAQGPRQLDYAGEPLPVGELRDRIEETGQSALLTTPTDPDRTVSPVPAEGSISGVSPAASTHPLVGEVVFEGERR